MAKGGIARKRSGKKKAQSRDASKAQLVVRRSISLEPEVDRVAHEAAGDGEFSKYVNDALRRDVQRQELLKLLADLDERFGPVDEISMRNAEALWHELHSTRER